MSIFQNSFLCCTCYDLWRAFVDLWKGSCLYSFFRALGAALRRAIGESRVCRFLWRDGLVERGWEGSVTCRAATAVVNLPCAAARLLYRAAPNLWEGSAVFRLLGGMGAASAALVGLALLVMLCVPHDYWNNLYALLLLVGVTALYLVAAARGRRRLEWVGMGPYLTFFFAFVTLAMVTSLLPGLSLRFFLFHMTGLLTVLLLVSAVERVEQVQGAVVLAGAGVLAASLYGCYQGVIGVQVVASQQDMVLNKDMPGRVYSFFDNPNNFAEVLVMLLPLLLALLLNSETFRGRLLALVCLAVGVAAIGYTYSRSGWLGLILAAFIFLALQNWRVVPVALGLGLLAIPFLPETILNRFLTIGNMEDSSTAYRFAIYEATGNVMRDFWFRGVGLGSDVMTKVFAKYPTMHDGNHPIHTHNNYLQMWAELGLCGVVAYLALVVGHLKKGVKSFYAAKDKRVRNLLSAAVGAFGGILLIGVAEYTWFYPRNMFIFWFLFGVIAACVKLVRKEREE